jgi:hypothetical protein
MTLLPRLPLLLGLSLFLVFGVPAQTAPGASGLKMTIRFTANGYPELEETIYLQGDRKRMESRNSMGSGVHADGSPDNRPGPRTASITRCDLGERFELNLEDGEYALAAPPMSPQTRAQIEAQALQRAQTVRAEIPTVKVETTIVDTGERKDFFGHQARHVVTTTKQTPLAGSHAEAHELVMDTWYIDLDPQVSCDMRWPSIKRGHGYVRVGGPAPETYEYINKGLPDTGFAVELQTKYWSTHTLSDGTKKENSFANEMRVEQFVEGALDPALFEIPASYRKVDDIRRIPPRTVADMWSDTQVWLKGMAARIFN